MTLSRDGTLGGGGWSHEVIDPQTITERVTECLSSHPVDQDSRVEVSIHGIRLILVADHFASEYQIDVFRSWQFVSLRWLGFGTLITIKLCTLTM